MPPLLSAILIATDEERDLPGCLESLQGLADEIVVVVSEETADRTEELARAAGAKVIRRKFIDYASQRQVSLDAAAGDWCLWIDPDERVTPPLRDEIRSLLAAADADAYDIRFEVRFLGRPLRWGGMGRESHVRLFRRGKARFQGGLLHEGLDVAGATGRLRHGRMVHVPYEDLGDYLSKLDRYTSLAARKRWDQGQRFHRWHHLILPWEFFARAVLKLGILDGGPGLIWAGLAAFHSWLKYVKLGEIQKEAKPC
ncbi:MAG: glycosyltransferase family 2 protein [Elusimicrobia bacterium]|nr:glycosyltransferase family 2 protein [Elusimicrobiota bacterium]